MYGFFHLEIECAIIYMIDEMLYFPYAFTPFIGFMKGDKTYSIITKYPEFNSVFSNPFTPQIAKTDRSFFCFC